MPFQHAHITEQETETKKLRCYCNITFQHTERTSQKRKRHSFGALPLVSYFHIVMTHHTYIDNEKIVIKT